MALLVVAVELDIHRHVAGVERNLVVLSALVNRSAVLTNVRADEVHLEDFIGDEVANEEVTARHVLELGVAVTGVLRREDGALIIDV